MSATYPTVHSRANLRDDLQQLGMHPVMISLAVHAPSRPGKGEAVLAPHDPAVIGTLGPRPLRALVSPQSR
jgi:hypothetical protein